MANIFTTINKEVEKGNTLLDVKGNFLPLEKVETLLKKSYLAGLKEGSISFGKSFEDYKNEEMEKTYIPVSAVEKVLLNSISGSLKTESAPMPEPEEPETANKEKVAK